MPESRAEYDADSGIELPSVNDDDDEIDDDDDDDDDEHDDHYDHDDPMIMMTDPCSPTMI